MNIMQVLYAVIMSQGILLPSIDVSQTHAHSPHQIARAGKHPCSHSASCAVEVSFRQTHHAIDVAIVDLKEPVIPTNAMPPQLAFATHVFCDMLLVST